MCMQHNSTEIDLNKLPKASLLREITVNAEEGNLSSIVSSSSSSMATTPSQTLHSAAQSNSDSKSNGHPSQTAVIIAACLGTTLLAVIGLFIAYFILRRRRRKFATTYLDSRYAFTNSAAPSPAPSRARLLQKLRNTSGDTPPSIDMTRKGTDEDTSWPDTLNFYHTPRPPPKAVVKRPSHNTGSSTVVSNGTSTSLSSMRFSPKTERQMEIEERIEELKGKLPLLQQSTPTSVGRPDSRTLTDMTHHVRVLKWRNQIDKLQELMTSEWALGRTDIVPKGLYGHESIV
ncbi:hypothetical protein GYMLUDRAFT_54068 [Collybiopsis luxurians FD-317 M1]|nr:hypothetical protein GYMLUDRAFT_54068 [Collybiopsis luxurians FD-317 M1]